jgi:hypothetical protein
MPASTLNGQDQLTASRQQITTLSKQYQAANGKEWTSEQRDQAMAKVIVDNGYDKLSIGRGGLGSPNNVPYVTDSPGYFQTVNISEKGTATNILGTGVPASPNPVATQAAQTSGATVDTGTDGSKTTTVNSGGTVSPLPAGSTDAAKSGNNTNTYPIKVGGKSGINPELIAQYYQGQFEDGPAGGNTGITIKPIYNALDQTGSSNPNPNTQIKPTGLLEPSGFQITSGGKATAKPSNQGGQGKSDTVTIRGNKLHDYVNWTYRISLHMIPRDTVNQMYTGAINPDGGSEAILANSIFVCADGGLGGYERSQYFPTDLSIDNVEMQTIVGQTQRTRGSDVIKIKFEITEPYTANFMGSLITASREVNPDGTWDTTFFCLKIEFLGYDDQGQPQTIPDTTKYIPMTLLNMTFKISSSGAIYYVDAIPCNDMAKTVLDNVIPFHVEVQASTVKDLFNGELSSKGNATAAPKSAREAELNTVQENPSNTNGTTTVIKGLDKALNNAEVEKTKSGNKGQTLPNVYEFRFDPAIGDAKIADPKKYQTGAVAMTSGKDPNAIQAGKVGSLTADFNNNTFRAQAGTKITDFISSIIKISTFMTDQHKPDGGNKDQPLYTYKINPVVKWGPVDPATNYYQRTVRFVVTPYQILGQDAQGFGQKPPASSDIVKQYNYIYTGDNKDIINVGIEYKMAFFELKNGVPTNYINKTNETPGSDTPPAPDKYDGSTDPRWSKPKYLYTRGLANQQNTGPTTINQSNIAVGELMNKLFDNDADMIQLDITIVGDPDWIDQDTVLFGPEIGPSPYIGNGSINFTRETYFNFFFRTANTDYDDQSGLFNQDGDYSTFSGTYNVIQVTSYFQKGKFTQKLLNVRTRNQTESTTVIVRSDKVIVSSDRNTNPTAEKASNKTIVPNPPGYGGTALPPLPINTSPGYSEDNLQP